MKIIGTDFDGTLCTNDWPNIGSPNVRLIEYLKNCRKHGIKVILITMREGKLLDDALEFCKNCGLEFDVVNDNLPEMIEMYGCNPRKVYFDWYIDDHNAICGMGKRLPDLKRWKLT